VDSYEKVLVKNENLGGGIFNIGSGKQCSIQKLAVRLQE